MRFPHLFRRYVPSPDGAPSELTQLGADTPPTGEHRGNVDNQTSLRLSNVNGYPVQRLVVGYVAPSEDAPPVRAWVLVHEDNSGAWFRTELTSRELHPGVLTYFDLPTLADNSNVGSREVGAIDLCVLVMPDEDAPPGVHTFVVGGDVSCPA